MLTSFIPHSKTDIVYPAKHNNIYKLCSWMHHARRTKVLNINFLALSKAEVQTNLKKNKDTALSDVFLNTRYLKMSQMLLKILHLQKSMQI